MFMKSASNINKNQKLCLADLLFVACSSCKILKHRLNYIFDCHLTGIIESFQDTYIKKNSFAHIHFKMLRCNFYFLKILIDFRHIFRQSARKLNPKLFWGRSFANNFFLQFKCLFLPQCYSSVVVIHVQLCKHSWYTQPPKRRLVESTLIRCFNTLTAGQITGKNVQLPPGLVAVSPP